MYTSESASSAIVNTNTCSHPYRMETLASCSLGGRLGE